MCVSRKIEEGVMSLTKALSSTLCRGRRFVNIRNSWLGMSNNAEQVLNFLSPRAYYSLEGTVSPGVF